MRKAILILSLLILCALAFGQGGRTKHAGKAGVKTKPKPTPSPKQPKLKDGPFYTPCGVYYKDWGELFNEIGKGWKFIGESKTDHLWYDSDKSRCTDGGILKAWIKQMHLGSDLQYALVLYELKCNADQYRIVSVTEYNEVGAVLSSDKSDDADWRDVVPESVAEVILKAVCRAS